MEFMFLFTEREDASARDPERFAEMKEFAGELAGHGQLRRGAPLAPSSDGARIRVRDGRALVSDGPFAESKEVVGGVWIVDVGSREAALEIARRCPHARYGTVEVHRVRFRDAVPDRGKGVPFLLAFRMEPGLRDPDGSKLREMMEFGATLKQDGTLLEIAPLADEPPPARIETRSGKVLVTDGPFAESKEAIGGYSIVRIAGRMEAIELAKRFPHARWGPVEVREILYFDPV